MTSVDVEYYRKRALAERMLVTASPTDEVAAIHADLAAQYEALVEQPALRSSFRIRWSAPMFDHPPTPRP